MAALVAVLAPEVTLISDGGGLAPAPRRAIRGREPVANALLVFVGRTAGLAVGAMTGHTRLLRADRRAGRGHREARNVAVNVVLLAACLFVVAGRV